MTPSFTSHRSTILRYLSIGHAYCPALDPDGKRVAFVSDITGVPQVWRVAAPVGLGDALWPDQLTFGEDGVKGLWGSSVRGDGRLIFARDAGGNENAQLYLLSSDGATETLLTPGNERAVHLLGDWSADGSTILFAANRRHPGLFDLYLQRLGGESRMVWQNDSPGFLFDMHLAPDGSRVVATREYGSLHDDLIEIDIESGGARVIVPPEEAVYPRTCYAPDGRSLLVNTDLGTGRLHIARLDLAARTQQTMIEADWDVQFLAVSPDGRRLAYTINVEGADELYVFDIPAGAGRRAPAFSRAPGVVAGRGALMSLGSASFSADGSRLAFSFSSATRSDDVYIWDLTAGEVLPATRSSHAGLPQDTFVSPELVRYLTFDGGTVPAWYYRPQGPSDVRLPACVLVHGGPAGQSRPGFDFGVQLMVANGFAVLVPNVRGSTGYGRAYTEADEVEKRMDSVADLAHAAYWMRQQPGIDGDRIAVQGASYGGFMVLAALTHYPDLWAAGVDIVGISNFVTFLENTSLYRRAHREAEYGSLARDRAFLERIAPINHLDRIRAPLLVIHGANDPRVPLTEARQLVTALEARGVATQLIVFDDEGHGVVKRKNLLVAYPAILEFLKAHLKG